MKNKKTVLVVYNPVSGMGKFNSFIDEFYSLLKDKKYEPDFFATKYANQAKNFISICDNYDIVFSVGGDGTLNEIIQGNFLRDEKLNICPIPNGTCNDVAKMLGYSKNPLTCLRQAMEGENHKIDITTINDTPFLYVAGMGKFLNIPYETKSSTKRKIGYLAYLKQGLIEFNNKMKLYDTNISIDNKDFSDRYSLIMISNSNHIAGINNFHKDVYLDDKKVEVLLCKAKNNLEFINSFASLFMGLDNANIIKVKGNEINLSFSEYLDKSWCIDGEEFISDSKNYNLKVTDQMNFVVPKNVNKRLFLKK